MMINYIQELGEIVSKPLGLAPCPRPINILRSTDGPRDLLLERRVGILVKLREVGLEPRTSLRGGLQGRRGAAVVVVSSGARVAGAVALATRLNPYESIEEGIARVGRRAKTEASTLSIAPVTPFVLASGLLAAAAGVGYEVGVPAARLQ